jgi:hypothetical protein
MKSPSFPGTKLVANAKPDGGRRAQRLEYETAGFAEEYAKLVGCGRVHLLNESEQLLPHDVALAPA